MYNNFRFEGRGPLKSILNFSKGCELLIKFTTGALKNFCVGSVVEWLERRAREQHGLGSKPTRAILLCPWERHFTAHPPAWWSWQTLLITVISLLIHKRTAISCYLGKEVGVIAYHMY